MLTKTCPGCDFRASLNARACARCGRFFGDAAPMEVRRWIRDHARKVRKDHPELSREELKRYLQDHLLHDRGLHRAIEETPEPARWARISGGLLEEVGDLVRRLTVALGGEDPEAVRQVSWAIEEAIEDL